MNTELTHPLVANDGMDNDTFDQFAEQLERYVEERLMPAEGDHGCSLV